MKKGITFKDNIIKELVEETGLDESVVKDNVKFLLQRVKKLSKKKDVHGIYLPRLGTLYFRPLAMKRSNDSMSKYSDAKLEDREAKVKDFFDRFDLSKEYSIHMRRARFHDYRYTKGMTPQEMEKFQNDKVDEYQESKNDS